MPLATLHRPGNVDEPAVLEEVMAGLEAVARVLPVVFPMHPRTRKRLGEFGLEPVDDVPLHILEPVGYIDFLALTADADLVITDSGGIQEETTYLGTPCLTVRPNTERPVTLTHGTNRLVEATREAILGEAEGALGETKEPGRPELWDGKTAGRIVTRCWSRSRGCPDCPGA